MGRGTRSAGCARAWIWLCVTVPACAPPATPADTASALDDAASVFDAGSTVDAFDATPSRDAGPSLRALAIAPTGHDFGDVPPGATPISTDFVVTNTGTLALGGLGATLAGPSTADFTITSTDCDALTVGATCGVHVAFAPAAEGPSAVTLVVTSGTTATTAGLTGTGRIPPPLFTLAPASADFGYLPPRESGVPVVFTVTSGATTAIGPFAAAITGLDAMQFVLLEDHCSGVTLDASGSTCTLTAAAAGSSFGSHTALLDVSAPGAGRAGSALLAGCCAPPPLQLTPVARDFGGAAVGTTTASTSFVLRNVSGLARPIDGVTLLGTDSTSFAIPLDGCTGTMLAGGATCSFDVTFTPTGTGPRVATLDVVAGTWLAMASLSGTGE